MNQSNAIEFEKVKKKLIIGISSILILFFIPSIPFISFASLTTIQISLSMIILVSCFWMIAAQIITHHTIQDTSEEQKTEDASLSTDVLLHEKIDQQISHVVS